MKTIKSIYLLFTILFSLLFFSCENTIPFKTNDVPQKLIVNALINSNKAENSIYLHLTGVNNVSFVRDGVIKIYLNGTLKETIRVEEMKDEWGADVEQYVSRLLYSPGDAVRMEVETEDGKYQAYAELTVPAPVAIEKIDTMTFRTNGQNNMDYIRLKTTFTDVPESKDFYRILVDRYQTFYGVSRITGNDTSFVITSPASLIIHEDVVLTEGRPGTINENDDLFMTQNENLYTIFDDTRLNGTYSMITTLSLYSYYYFYDGDIKIERMDMDVNVRLISLTEAEYYYLRALNIYDSDNYDDVFSPPILFPTNVNGGTGIVGASSESAYKVNVRKDMIIDNEYPFAHW